MTTTALAGTLAALAGTLVTLTVTLVALSGTLSATHVTLAVTFASTCQPVCKSWIGTHVGKRKKFEFVLTDLM